MVNTLFTVEPPMLGRVKKTESGGFAKAVPGEYYCLRVYGEPI
jgi:hypothetical protein